MLVLFNRLAAMGLGSVWPTWN